MGKGIDLFKLEVPENKLHPNFEEIDKERLPYLREVINNWAMGFSDRDGKFVKEFQSTFNSSFWELYLFAVLKKLKHKIDFSKNRPDFVIKDSEFVIEATTANHAKNMQAEWERTYSSEEVKEWSVEKTVNNATIRLANSFVSKSEWYIRNFEKLEYIKDKSFVLAIAPFDSPYFFMQNHQAIRRVLYGFDRYIAVDINEKEREVIDAVFLDEIDKGNSKIPLGYFTNEKYSHISAVIFSSLATVGKARMVSDDPRLTLASFKKYNSNGTQPFIDVLEKSEMKEDLLDGLVVFHNPYAKKPLDNKIFDHPLIAQVTGINDEENINVPHNMLLQREVVTIAKSNGWSKKKKAKVAKELKLEILKKESSKQFPIFHH
ncbi:hypothetical protein MOB71_08255 [Bacillus spizizenii]|uniref:hypothetical protein n=1 Tax=Bacillus subtilis group TaxID=653685 RepID=UPI00227ED9CB|nr:hypothetical protein [Bacillus spizizenii]MCY9315751.1 hypothetical protein [Bacillus spizizenii]MDH3077596.1 hypothetical protein [Bacillus velezensis]